MKVHLQEAVFGLRPDHLLDLDKSAGGHLPKNYSLSPDWRTLFMRNYRMGTSSLDCCYSDFFLVISASNVFVHCGSYCQ